MPIENEKTSSERVNIVYKSPGDEGEGKELPFKVLVLGDFTQSEDPVPLSEREPLQITADNLDAVTRALAPKLDLMARETFSGIEKNEIPVSLTFESLKDFQPESLVAKIGPARKVISLRESLLS
ncbi:MAG: type VI secretion system contractile sheath small subunit, partial [Deltaproteobacteria bacterium]|nr:type VI secretion system contractile sheath small subunit [Deltaproteobacteria bacterium]